MRKRQWYTLAIVFLLLIVCFLVLGMGWIATQGVIQANSTQLGEYTNNLGWVYSGIKATIYMSFSILSFALWTDGKMTSELIVRTDTKRILAKNYRNFNTEWIQKL